MTAVAPDDATWTDGLALVDSLRAAAPAIIAGAASRLADELGPRAEEADVAGVTAETLELLLAAVARRRRPEGAEVDAVAGASSAMAARQGLPVDTVLQRHRLVSNEVWRAVTEAAAATEISQATLLEVASLVWDGTDLLMVAAARAHRLAEREQERQHEEERRSFLRALLLGSIAPAELDRQATRFGLPLDRPVVPFRARTRGGMALHRLEAAILAGTTAEAPGLTALLEGTLLGVLPATPELADDTAAVVGVGPAGPLSEAKAAFQHATRALETAYAFDLDGVFGVEDLPLRALVASEPHIGDSLVARYLEPLDSMGQFGPAVEQTLRAFFERGMRVEETARSLEVHPNTLRHRLRRFEEVTGTDMGRTEELFRIWWALERRRLLRGLQTRPVTT